MGGRSAPEVSSGDPAVILGNLKLVDAIRISWDKLLELRQDESAAAHLRNLRLFLVKEYTEGQNSEMIRDDLERRVQNYEQTVREWELDTRDGAISAIFSSKTILATSGALAAAVIAGGPLATILAPPVAFGLIFEVGKIALEVKKRERQLNIIKASDPVAYLVEARELQSD